MLIFLYQVKKTLDKTHYPSIQAMLTEIFVLNDMVKGGGGEFGEKMWREKDSNLRSRSNGFTVRPI